MHTLILTADKYLWCLRPFMHLWNKYCGIPATIAGFTPPPFPLEDGFTFHSIGRMEDYPVNKWSDALIKVLHEIPDEQVLLMLEDAWVTRPVNVGLVAKLSDYAAQYPEVLRIDLTTDRLYNSAVRDYATLQWIDLIVTPAPSEYLLSCCAGIWNKTQLLKYLIPGWSPWDFELTGSREASKYNPLVLGTRQLPMRHLFAMRATEDGTGRLDLKMKWGVPGHPLSDADIAEIQEKGWLP
jgi:hypothetical protein